MRQAKIIIEKLDGTKEEFYTDKSEDRLWGESVLGYYFYFDNGRKMIIHPNSIYRLVIEEINNGRIQAISD